MKLHSSLVTFYHNMKYKQRREYKLLKSERLFHGNKKPYGTFPATVQLFQQLIISSFSISMTVPLDTTFSADMTLLQNKKKYCRTAEQIHLVSKCCIVFMIKYFAKYTHQKYFCAAKFFVENYLSIQKFFINRLFCNLLKKYWNMKKKF